jgi:hypothetical protein
MKTIATLSKVLAVLFCVSCTSGNPDMGPVIPAENASEYVVFAWNDLGMHCLNPTYDVAVILPPYNTVESQVVKRGNPPQLVTDAVVGYELADNTFSYGKGDYGQFWDNMDALFHTTKAHDVGLAGKGLSGTMDWDAAAGVYRVVGIPVVPRTDSAPTVRAPYQQALILAKTSGGTTLASTKATVPTSDEINCAKCHGTGTPTSAFNDILVKHDDANSTSLTTSKPVLCASCHSSPALGTPINGTIPYLSKAIHGFHSTEGATCLDCHPGETTKCNRSLAHATTDVNCQSCHGTMDQVAASIPARIPWVHEPKCSDCHTSSTGTTPTTGVAGSASAIPEVDTNLTLYRNATGHGGLRCTACHGSPHAMVPSREAIDNYQAVSYQGKAVTIGSCAACHSKSRGEGASEFMEKHGGTNPEEYSACAVCHTAVPSGNTTLWPHDFKWKAR